MSTGGSSNTSSLLQNVMAALNEEKTWPSDVTLFALPEESELLSDVAQCHSIRALFACHGLIDCYTIERRHNAEFMAPPPHTRGVPFLCTGGSVVGYEDIVQFMHSRNYVLNQVEVCGVEDQLIMDGILSLVHSKLLPIEMYVTWREPANRNITRERYEAGRVQPLKSILFWKKSREVSRYMKAMGFLEKSEAQIRAEIVSIYKCISDRLENTLYIMGEEITEADVFVFGHLQAILESKLEKNILMEEMQNFPKLTQFCLNFNQVHLGNKAMIWEFL